MAAEPLEETEEALDAVADPVGKPTKAAGFLDTFRKSMPVENGRCCCCCCCCCPCMVSARINGSFLGILSTYEWRFVFNGSSGGEEGVEQEEEREGADDRG